MKFTFREVVACVLLLFFGIVLAFNPNDQTVIGALLTAFAAAWGFYLGGSKVGSDTAEQNAATVTAQAQAPKTDPDPSQAGDKT